MKRDETGEWECPRCGRSNRQKDTACLNCRAPSPGSRGAGAAKAPVPRRAAGVAEPAAATTSAAPPAPEITAEADGWEEAPPYPQEPGNEDGDELVPESPSASGTCDLIPQDIALTVCAWDEAVPETEVGGEADPAPPWAVDRRTLGW